MDGMNRMEAARICDGEREVELAELGDALAYGVDALVGEGECPVFIGEAQHEDAAVLVGEVLGHEPDQVLGDAQPNSDGPSACPAALQRFRDLRSAG